MDYAKQDNRPAIKYSQSVILLIKEHQEKNGHIKKPKTANRSVVLMQCLESIT
jgi:hypothetical protein